MAFTDRIRRQLLDGVTFIPKEVPSSAPDHLFLDPDLQLRMGIGSDVAHIPVVANPQMADIPAYNASLKMWQAVSAAQAKVASGSFTTDQWSVEGGIASIILSHSLNTQSINTTVFDMTSGIPTETYVELQAYSTSSIKLMVAAGAIFSGAYIINVIVSAGSALSPGGGSVGSVGSVGGGGILNMSAVSGSTSITWGTNRCVKATLVGNATISFDVLGSLVADRVTLTLSQDGTGGRTVSWGGANIKWSNGFQPDASQAPGSADLYEFVWDGTNYTCVNFIANIS